MTTESCMLKLNSGYKIPRIGLGTWLSSKEEVGGAVKDALEVGYRHLDCAHVYGNQKQIGEALEGIFQNNQIRREDVFITSKLWSTYHSTEKVAEGISIILQQLRLEYLDLLLIHWPMGFDEKQEPVFNENEHGEVTFSNVDYLETWQAMENAMDQGLVHSIGLSNFNTKQIQRVMNNCRIKPAVLQVEMHPYLTQQKLLKWCQDRDILVTAYSSLGNMGHVDRQSDQPNLLEESVVKHIAKTHDKKPGEVLLRWGLQRNTVILPKSTKRSHIEENFNLWDFNLSEEEMESLNQLDRGLRLTALEMYKSHVYYPFTEV